ncbi:type I-F CRISPR-associated endoribonuclease Cas6/Csy4 [Alkalilimnicola sp. S0819]|uniref:type I-F CRISPR-associated endoribonuclease Cas6/Csy4 n=1 Tax=Alkalilimnicola sp. S0819 TaxID=2613922 RepID=UPI001261C010|nr:type I-F CRISPR-associated endoribonuclease Cas6/Csy4 [Alkalilimnicola sp. S0819]KAB7624022.1 type I-F CRISPR-associated endoribonuclease Cas6/Csy4 [Alkalilimnicola sp. S0819]MPQ16630.1 type I-F CRISPR-associated endoribonuclease Cas6/Csy4 [Alkalilimnicola sp. S0819]
MKHYLDITLRPDPEFSPPMLMSALFSKLHRGLVCLEAEDIGVSFPGYSISPRSLGESMRLHSRAERLKELMALNWLSGMHDHIQLGDIGDVPADAPHRQVRRVQPKTNAARLRRRYIKRHQVSELEAAERIPDSVERSVSLPFVTVRSRSTGQSFCLFLKQGDVGVAPRAGVFSRYGLSAEATVPWF